ncbi:hypothetical protein B296_00022480 [Ensete ventricosum]|uniref:Uncharacterized protein n=1 Tax=Ensete ventricosum TaxID=4639 RepID=A0A426YI36_ENSVE|nr:hypothetical protein B296_00022480 [Ensete ventricosum]
MTDYNQRIGQSQVQASGQSEDDAVGNSPGVRRELAEGIRNLLGWCKGVRWKKTETHRKIIGGYRKACRELERPRIKLRHQAKVWTMQWELADTRTSLKVSRISLGDHQRKIVRLAVGNVEGCWITGVRSLIELGGHIWL